MKEIRVKVHVALSIYFSDKKKDNRSFSNVNHEMDCMVGGVHLRYSRSLYQRCQERVFVFQVHSHSYPKRH